MSVLSAGLRSPPTPRSEAASPRPKFDGEQLKPYIKQLLVSTLQNVPWTEAKDRTNGSRLIKEIGGRVKERMLRAFAPDLRRVRCAERVVRRDRASKFVRHCPR